MHKLVRPGESLSLPLDKSRWMCRGADTGYSCPFVTAAVVSAAQLTGSLEWFKIEKDAVCCLTS